MLGDTEQSFTKSGVMTVLANTKSGALGGAGYDLILYSTSVR